MCVLRGPVTSPQNTSGLICVVDKRFGGGYTCINLKASGSSGVDSLATTVCTYPSLCLPPSCLHFSDWDSLLWSLVVTTGELGSFTSAYTHFEGLGHGQNVPSYLRATGMIRNQMLTRAQASALVSAIWTAKKERDKDMAKISAPAISLADILEQYFLGVFESKNTALETAYSFMSVLKSTETATAGWTEGRMFKLVLDGTLHEDVSQGHDYDTGLTVAVDILPPFYAIVLRLTCNL